MHTPFRLALIGLFAAGLLTACGGGDTPITKRDSNSEVAPEGGGAGSGGDGGEGAGGEGDNGGSTPVQGTSYLPLAVFEAFSDFSGASSDGLFQGDGESPLIPRYLINPIDAATLQPATTVAVGDYKVTVNGLEISANESYPILQKVLGNRIMLRTALVFDVSDSASGVDINELVAAAKAYITAAKAPANPATIRDQEFVIWAFAQGMNELTTGFTDVEGDLHNDLDDIVTLFNNRSLGVSTNLHQAIVQAVGRYDATGEGLSNFGGDGNDLIDVATADGILLSQLVVFSSGGESGHSLPQDLMERAIASQSFLRYGEDAEATTDNMLKLKKPVFYYVVGNSSGQPGETYAPLQAQAENTSDLLLVGGHYDFAQDLIGKQLAAISARIDLNQQYLYRYAFLPRLGDHTTVFSSKATGFNYSLTTQFDDAGINPPAPAAPIPSVAPTVEITGPNGEYLSAETLVVPAGGITVRAATRWRPEPFASGDLSWIPTNITGTNNGDGTYRITGITGANPELELRGAGAAAGLSYTLELEAP